MSLSHRWYLTIVIVQDVLTPSAQICHCFVSKVMQTSTPTPEKRSDRTLSSRIRAAIRWLMMQTRSSMDVWVQKRRRRPILRMLQMMIALRSERSQPLFRQNLPAIKKSYRQLMRSFQRISTHAISFSWTRIPTPEKPLNQKQPCCMMVKSWSREKNTVLLTTTM